ncbi:Low temperature requirement A [Ascosphaera apis ARSEF 7405]|uniref:Low temperature requirement A n=1 Tax=Ascosphaera apis ARSEF 7405 TaxID=392613 RepID=A0A167YY42_9EURO|nr:Low temperature requirement A [Ascosphaera apis ARSEF 7405]
MNRPLALSFHQGRFRGLHSDERELRRGLPWIRSPINLKYGLRFPQLFRHSDATPIELFFDLFFVANVSTFSSIHEINKLEALFSYIGFFSIIWFTWLQITLHDVRFARDSILERTFKALQLATMVGFASTGPSFSTNIRFENRWAFKSLTVILACSRVLLGLQHAVAASFMITLMKPAYKKTLIMGATYCFMALAHGLIYVGFREETTQGYYVWIAWTGMFAIETFIVFWISCKNPILNLEETHLNSRMSLLTLIIIGEGVISITNIFCGSRISIFLLDKRLGAFGSVCG